MDDKDILFRIRNSFYLGNYNQVLETWKECVNSNINLSPTVEQDVHTIMQRTLIFFIIDNTEVLKANQEYFTKFKSTMNMYVQFLNPQKFSLGPEANAKLLAEFLTFVEQKGGQVDPIALAVINNFLALAAKMYKSFIPVPRTNTGSWIEYNALLFRAHLECRDFKSADNVLSTMKAADDEDILVNLCKIENYISKNDFDAGIQLVQELRDKFEDSAKLLSLAASCFMGKREFEKAEKTLDQ